MNNNIFLKITLALLFMFSLSGCGSNADSETNGQLTLDASAPVTGASSAVLTATATVIPGSGSLITVRPGLPGADVDFTYSQYGFNSSTNKIEILESNTESAPTNSLGVATFSKAFLQSQDMATTIQITAKFGGLTSKTVNITVPKYVP